MSVTCNTYIVPIHSTPPHLDPTPLKIRTQSPPWTKISTGCGGLGKGAAATYTSSWCLRGSEEEAEAPSAAASEWEEWYCTSRHTNVPAGVGRVGGGRRGGGWPPEGGSEPLLLLLAQGLLEERKPRRASSAATGAAAATGDGDGGSGRRRRRPIDRRGGRRRSRARIARASGLLAVEAASRL